MADETSAELAIRAATLSGFRQALEQMAQQLRRQTQAWRDAQLATVPQRATAAHMRKVKAELAVTEGWCGRVDEIAQLLEAEARKRLAAENALRSQSLQSQQQQSDGVVARVLDALRPRRKR